ncbi:GH36-type glycosyl hydrolase domain-containing protein [Albirhodobacter sp. R86504]|uniref:GH36-type glycosyl hydrolase domain-containing protein n=1 Tax=Albirhodobacter sp. R86504 TaxID=3093848 RepID=UPI00366F5479
MIRSELFGTERLEHHALSLAAAQTIRPMRRSQTDRRPAWFLGVLARGKGTGDIVLPLTARVEDNAEALLAAYRSCARNLHEGRAISPAAEWLLDNFHLVEQQLRQIASDLPPDYYRQLPKLAQGPFAGYPRVLGVAWAYVAHSDSLLSERSLARFVKSYQTVSPLTIGEIWAIAITLRIVLVENMRRLAGQIALASDQRAVADASVDLVLTAKGEAAKSPFDALHHATVPLEGKPLPDIVAAQIAKRLRGFDPSDTPLLAWLEDRLQQQGTSVEAVVQRAQLRQGASNITMRNIVTSMRLASELDWADFVEEVSLIDTCLRENSAFAQMDFATRNSYRTAIEVLARGSDLTELEVAAAALRDGEIVASVGPSEQGRAGLGGALIGPQRAAFERQIGYRPPLLMRLLRPLRRLGLRGYVGAIVLISIEILAVSLWAAGVSGFAALALGLAGAMAATEAGTALVNLVITRSVKPRLLPALDLSAGIPPALCTLVAVPVMLRSLEELHAQIEQLEVHHLSSVGGALHYALLSDGPDAPTETTPQDAVLLAQARAAIEQLNASYPSAQGNRFLFLHRHRQWNASEGVWMGWERKRGKLTELNRLLRGALDTSFLPHSPVPQDVQFVITLDADTRLLRDTVARMIGKMAHPLNRAIFDPTRQRVIAGYGILQPRVTPSLPIGTQGSLFQQVFSSPGGIEPYAAAISNVYQDLFGEGSFTGKGIYDVDAFSASLKGRVPENSLLSHDLFEGIYARAGLATDIDVVEDYPARFDVAARRQHRWVRGDWQLLPWIFGASGRALPAVGRWKMIDNLRRSLVAPFSVLALGLGMLLPLPIALAWAGAVLLMLSLPQLVGLPFAILPGRAGITARSHVAALRADARTSLAQIALNIAFLATTAAQMGDAITRTLFRLIWSRKSLLQWEPSAASGGRARLGLLGQYRQMAGGAVLALVICGGAVLFNPVIWPLALPLAVLWSCAPIIARRISLPWRAPDDLPLTAEQTATLRQIARSTWCYFETFVTEADHFLPPDNFQETPVPQVFHRTSPTNIGLYLLSTTVARDMGWIGQAAAVVRLEQTLATLCDIPKYRGHLFNWYDTRDLRVLEPAYVSSVDSGNLAGHLIAVAQACREWREAPLSKADRHRGLADTLALARQSLPPEATSLAAPDWAAALAAISAANARHESFEALRDLAGAALAQGDAPDGLRAVRRCIADHIADDGADTGPDTGAAARLATAEDLARRLAMEMDFAFLLDPDKKLLSIGFSVSSNALDLNCYDLLASEARLASLFAIAKGDVETRHWFRLGRSATPIGAGSALISWSGSMFEYLMPSLVMRAPKGSVLDQTNRLIVARQIAYGAANAMPWGVSESSYNARDLEMTYQYSNFGVPGLGLKRGLSANRVVAPYATALAAMVDPRAALRNLAHLESLGVKGDYGFYEAVDFTLARMPQGIDHAVVRSFMAHHQGMTITAIANTVMEGALRRRFHAEPMIQGVDLLLQERVPRDATSAPPHAEEVLVAATETSDTPILRRFDAPDRAAPTGHLLSNGQYGLMLTPQGEGYSRWRDMAITRWQGETGQAALGSFIFARDLASGALWSGALQPTGADPARHSAVFCEHHAAFTHQDARLKMLTEVVVSAEDDAEARRVTLTNASRHSREIELTSYAELVLAPPAADHAHPAFSKMFVVTDYLPELGVIIATRRRRSPGDPEIWAAHIAIVEGEESAEIQFETDRAQFIGRGGTISSAAMAQGPLSNTKGTVLDPIFAIRRTVKIPAGGMARVTFWTAVAQSPEALLDQVDRHRDPSAFDRAVTLSWTQAQVQLRHLGITQAAAADFQRLGGMILRGDPRLRAPDARIEAGAGPQSGLWPMGISGDLPIVLFLIRDNEDTPALKEVLAAQEYWQMRQLDVDLVILNERSSSYIQDMQIAIEVAVRSAQSRPRAGRAQEGAQAAPLGRVYTLRADLISAEARALLLAVSGVVLVASRGKIGVQLDALPRGTLPRGASAAAKPLLAKEGPRLPRGSAHNGPATPVVTAGDDLEFFNGTGGFAKDGREYVTLLRDGQTTPAPWINVIANPNFGFQVSVEGSGSVWAQNSRENQLTPWSNDPVTDPSGEAIYLRDLESGAIWTPTALPIRGRGDYTTRHGFGYSQFEHEAQGIAAVMVQFVPLEDPVKITRLILRNTGTRKRRLSLTAYAEWVLGARRSAHILTTRAPQTGAILARNPYATAFAGEVAFADLGAAVTSVTTDRAEFLGQGGRMDAPQALAAEALSNRVGPAPAPCAALQRGVTLDAGESVEIVFLLGQAASAEAAGEVIMRYREPDAIAAALAEVGGYWADLLGAVQVTSPDRAMDIMLNGWLLYQTLACRIWARAGFYQASGAYGFRDQLQDGMALTALRPQMTRDHLLRAAGRQFAEGDVQHWWLPHSGQGVRTRISDDRIWLGYGVAQYISVSGDAGVLDIEIAFIEGPALLAGAHDDFFLPHPSDLRASLFEHCARGLDLAIAQTGANGLPLIGTGDWNDGMNRVGEGGAGTSVWLAWFLIATLNKMAPHADTRDPARAARWRAHAAALTLAVEREGWDGAWYRRGTYDDGAHLGSASSLECRIDSIAQSWAVLSGAANPARAATAMASLTEHLIRPEAGVALLFTPPFDQTSRDPGYIKGYPPGLRENGGQYSHAAMWAILAQCKLGNGDAAGALFALVNPINHALTPQAAERYKGEPYVIAADVYSCAPHEGRAGWTWYTGSAGWMYRAGIEGLLGLTRAGDHLTLAPCFPAHWPQIEAKITHHGCQLLVTITNPHHSGHGIESATLDGVDLPLDGGCLRLQRLHMPQDSQAKLRISLGA